MEDGSRPASAAFSPQIRDAPAQIVGVPLRCLPAVGVLHDPPMRVLHCLGLVGRRVDSQPDRGTGLLERLGFNRDP